ncbi:hypothetical protein BX616_007878 [Lobosporangium transversale]|uniref:tRNA-splicing endonuclease subunit Sen15 domain-containing protein n=1 Tax=Lobosporangium transversale TaxID=64571 RepID=A0A1Y2GNZ3_9FUNG|nr:hypothetical protein BCR41DRAFT_396097 [Lobosporangium transversale]KAF9914642.1 hypothetical protein BX616_007878 [Lobosporangium transversale]ORZ16829.1 hypothetical protein BCR41DRAFT_396097 [Lobosporangium transversale]|eukprot:XP_021881764.1 hypothetical protein BCR41DRAFT_396097 [Lobosporangium transversale]
MECLALHPKFHEIREECLSFPDHAEQLLQIYLDLTQAKDFENVHVIKAPLLGRCLIEGTHPDNGLQYMILPAHTSEEWSVAKMEFLFDALQQEQDLRLKDAAKSKITIGLITTDSTVTYLNLTRGL